MTHGKSGNLTLPNLTMQTTANGRYAISIKQPWATLIVHGLKTIEVRRWSTPRRGHVLIHAARVPDARPEAWRKVPEHLLESARRGGGVIGAAEVVACLTYRNAADFAKDHDKHLNEASWFIAPALYGFAFDRPAVLPFYKFPGWLRFFLVEPPPPGLESIFSV